MPWHAPWVQRFLSVEPSMHLGVKSNLLVSTLSVSTLIKLSHPVCPLGTDTEPSDSSDCVTLTKFLFSFFLSSFLPLLI